MECTSAEVRDSSNDDAKDTSAEVFEERSVGVGCTSTEVHEEPPVGAEGNSAEVLSPVAERGASAEARPTLPEGSSGSFTPDVANFL